EHGRLQRRESSQREKRDVRSPLLREDVDEGVVLTLGHVIEVLDADDLRDSLPVSELPGSHVAETDMPNQPLSLQFRKHPQRFRDRSFRWVHNSTHPKISDSEPVVAEIPKIVMDS